MLKGKLKINKCTTYKQNKLIILINKLRIYFSKLSVKHILKFNIYTVFYLK